MRAPVSESRPPYPLPNPYPLKNNFVVSTTKRRGWERGWEKLGKGEKNPIQSPSKNIMLTQYQGKNETKQKQTKNQSFTIFERFYFWLTSKRNPSISQNPYYLSNYYG